MDVRDRESQYALDEADMKREALMRLKGDMNTLLELAEMSRKARTHYKLQHDPWDHIRANDVQSCGRIHMSQEIIPEAKTTH